MEDGTALNGIGSKRVNHRMGDYTGLAIKTIYFDIGQYWYTVLDLLL